MGDIFQFAALGMLVLGFFIHVALMISVWADASQRVSEKKPVVFLGPVLWGLTVLCTGLFGLLLYWLIHHSALRRLYDKEDGHGSARH